MKTKILDTPNEFQPALKWNVEPKVDNLQICHDDSYRETCIQCHQLTSLGPPDFRCETPECRWAGVSFDLCST